MKQLLGEWHGTGTATFPTIETTNYREVLIFRPHESDAILQVEQKTWRIHSDTSESLLYWECGFLRMLTDTTCEWINAQNNGRTEVLKGSLIANANTVSINLHSVIFSNDSRMIQSSRQLDVMGDELTYTMIMATTAQPTMQQHLIANLRRY